ncbi:MAG: BapA prefix-like domain-containing protein [Alphaproteobacteria bacterium]|nr:BapA prefix-like domain-containing protein [Alphaproteobacteria bacterium]
MVAAIDLAVRGLAGGSQLGSVAGEGQGNFIQVGAGDSISLNLSRASIIGYERQGGDLVIQLADGRSIVLSGYFDAAAAGENKLYLSDSGTITEVLISDSGDGALFAEYGAVQGWAVTPQVIRCQRVAIACRWKAIQETRSSAKARLNPMPASWRPATAQPGRPWFWKVGSKCLPRPSPRFGCQRPSPLRPDADHTANGQALP